MCPTHPSPHSPPTGFLGVTEAQARPFQHTQYPLLVPVVGRTLRTISRPPGNPDLLPVLSWSEAGAVILRQLCGA